MSDGGGDGGGGDASMGDGGGSGTSSYSIEKQRLRQAKLEAMTPEERVRFLQVEAMDKKVINGAFMALGISILAIALTTSHYKKYGAEVAYDKEVLQKCVNILEENTGRIPESDEWFVGFKAKGCEKVVTRYLLDDNPRAINDTQLDPNFKNKISKIRKEYWGDITPPSYLKHGSPLK